MLKQKARVRVIDDPDELGQCRERSGLIRVHRVLNRPYRMVRRPLFPMAPAHRPGLALRQQLDATHPLQPAFADFC